MAGNPIRGKKLLVIHYPFARLHGKNFSPMHAGETRKERLITMDEVQVRKQAEALVAQMTVEEAASQLKI